MPDAPDRGFLREVYELPDQAAIDAYYSAWAASYDDELRRHGYRSPARCAEALAGFVPTDAAVLDIGCGTGISGLALAVAGFGDVSGTDVNADMLRHAERVGVYRELWLTDPAAPFPFGRGRYSALSAVGVIGIGAAPASLLSDALDALAPGGHLVCSLNERAMAVPAFRLAVEEPVVSGRAERVFSEEGPHLEALGTRSTVVVLRRR